jgi:hypothetical protein
MHFFRQDNPDGGSSGTLFTSPFGRPVEELHIGRAFNMRVTTTSATRGQAFTFPRSHTGYNDAQDNHHTVTTRAWANRFITDTVTMRADTTFLMPVNDHEAYIHDDRAVQVVNPYMAYLDMGRFLQENSAVLTPAGYFEWDGTDEHTFTPVLPGALMPPLRSFFVQKIAGIQKLETVRMSPNWTTTQGRRPYILRAEAVVPGVLRIRALQHSSMGEALLRYDVNATPAYNSSEDLRSLFYNANPLTLYTFAPATRQPPLALNVSGDFEQQTVPLGLYLKESGEVRLEFAGLETFGHEVYLLDSERGNEPVDLQQNPTYSFIANKPAGVAALTLHDRFALTFTYTGKGLTRVSEAPTSWTVSAHDGILHVQAAPGAVSCLEVYTAAGALVYRTQTASTDYRIPAEHGQMYILRACTPTGEETKKAVGLMR